MIRVVIAEIAQRLDFADDFIRARLRDALEVLRFRICLFYGFFGFLRTAAQADFIFIFLFCIIFYFVIKFLYSKKMEEWYS